MNVEIVIFHPLTRQHIAEIVGIQLRRVAQLLAERGYALEVSEAAREYLAEAGYARSSALSSASCKTRWRCASSRVSYMKAP
jgi:ATP-dependent Clp protease ATP-binding subunit ClpA